LENYPPLIDVPVLVLGGGNGAITFPIQQGDECIILFNDRELDNWFQNGGVQTYSTSRTHDLSDGIALVGLRSLPNVLNNYCTTGTSMPGLHTIDQSSPLFPYLTNLMAVDGDSTSSTYREVTATPILELLIDIILDMAGV